MQFCVRSALTVLIMSMCSVSSINAQSRDNTSRVDSLNLFANINGHYSNKFNKYGGQEHEQNVGYYGDRIRLVTIKGNAGALGKSLLTFNYSTTIPGTDFQKEAVSTSVEEKYGLKRYGLDLISDAIIDIVYPEGGWLKWILSVRYRYIRELTQTKSLINNKSTYLSSGSFVDYEDKSVREYSELSSDNLYVFRTDYKYQDITLSVPVIQFPMIFPVYYNEEESTIYGGMVGMRVGYAHWEYDRPFSTTFVQFENLPVVYEASVKTHALALCFSSLDPGSPGLHFDGTLALGVSSDIESTLDWKRVFEVRRTGNNPDRETRYKSNYIKANIWYNLYLTDWCFISAGVYLQTYEFHIADVDTSGDGNNTVKKLEHNSTIYNLRASVSLRF